MRHGRDVTESQSPAPFVPPAGNPRFPLVDGVRALAALSVLVFHIGSFSQANRYAWYGVFTMHLDVGVAVFFAISGFVLYRPFVVARHGGRQRRLAEYAIGRVLRLAPAYWVALVVSGVAGALVGVFSGDWWMYFGLVQSYFPGHSLDGLPVAWSLVVEASFYALLPVYAVVVGAVARRCSRRLATRFELVALAVLAAGSVVVQPLLSRTTIATTFDWFAGGMALAVVSVALASRAEPPGWARLLRRAPWLPWAGALACWLTLCLALGIPRDPTLGNPYWRIAATQALATAIGLLVLAPAVLPHERRGLVPRVLGTRTAAWLGLVSYGIYLWHWPVLAMVWKHGWTGVVAGNTVLSYALLGVPATIALAAASWYCVERPALALKSRIRPSRRPDTSSLDAPVSLEACPQPLAPAAR